MATVAVESYWNCNACTLSNVIAHTICSACFTDRGQKDAEGGTWSCEICTCVNSNLLSECDACTTPRIINTEPAKPEIINTGKGDTWVCPKCTFVNENAVNKCTVCEEGSKPSSVPTKSITPTKETNVVVKKEEPVEKKIEQKVEPKVVEKKKVIEEEEEEDEEEMEDAEEYDEEMEGEGNNEGHESEEEIIDEYAEYEDSYGGYDAMTDTPYEILVQNPALVDKKKSFLPPVHEMQALTILNQMQTQALRHIVEASKRMSMAAHPELEKRVKRLGFTAEQLQDTLRYIRDTAPIVIHVKLEAYLAKLLGDTHYRSQFETNTSGGTLSRQSRIEWENRMFNRIYDKSSDFDRVKYGVLNITRDPDGVKTAYSYGDSYLLLKNVRLRTTFASCDSSNAHTQISCCEYYEHVLATYTDPELSDLIAVATDPQGLMWKAGVGSSQYKEIQIHGPVDLSKNIEAVVVNARFRGNKEVKEQLDKFAKKNNCNILWMDELR